MENQNDSNAKNRQIVAEIMGHWELLLNTTYYTMGDYEKIQVSKISRRLDTLLGNLKE